MANLCPICGAVALTRTSRRLSNETREIYYSCTGMECLHQFKTYEGDPVTLALPINVKNLEYRPRLSPRKFGVSIVDQNQLSLDLKPIRTA